jgi:hypothetical protein
MSMFIYLKKPFACFAVLAALLAGSPAQAGVIPVGVHNDVSMHTVVNTWGWTLISDSDYGGSLSIADLFANHGQYVMIAAMRQGSGVIDVLAADLYTTVTTHTARDTTNASNGVGWYFNAGAMGFVGAGDQLCQSAADTCGWTERDRMSWHTSLADGDWVQDYGLAPTWVFNGYRAGDHTGIYTGTDWRRVVFTLDDRQVVSEPASLLLLGLGLALLGYLQARRKPRATPAG